MQPDKRIARKLVMVVGPERPTARVVAVLAIRPKCLLVLVHLQVTTYTIPLCIPETRGYMALLTGCQRVQPVQREPRLVVIKVFHLPIAVGMALLTFLSKLRFVLIVLLVTVKTLHGCIAETLEVSVAGLADDLFVCMGVAQGETRLGVVEAQVGRLPTEIIMAIRALVAQSGFVLVILLVA